MQGETMTGRSRRAHFGIFLALLCAGPLTALGQGALEAPRALTTPQPPAPTNARNVTVEGYVTVRYSVLADGTPSNVRAIDFMPPSIDPAPTVATVSGWKFTPGKRDGQAIDWHNNETVVVFRSTAGTEADPAEFQARYAAIETMLAAETPDFAAAFAASQSLLNEYAVRLADIGLAMIQSSVVQIRMGSLNSALGHLAMATDPRVPMLSGTELMPALQTRMRLEGQLGRVADAQETHARLAKGLGPNHGDAEFTAIGERLAMLAATEEFLQVTGRIVRDYWRIDASRRFFFIPSVEKGTVNTIVAECDTRRVELAFNPENDYQLPESFGACTIFVLGAPNTDFIFVEALPADE
jgi:Gram-negative bacterial TonB protein C-terminal